MEIRQFEEKRNPILSEAEADAAYAAWKMIKTTDPDLSGHILFFSYHQEKWNIVLSEVSCINGIIWMKTETQISEEKPQENRWRRCTEKIVLDAIEKGIKKKIQMDEAFYKTAEQFWHQMKLRRERIKDFYEENILLNLEDLKENGFQFSYHGTSVLVTYGEMAGRYQEIIREYLKEKLDFMIHFMEQHNIPYDDVRGKRFKIVLSEKICDSYMIRTYLEKYFRCTSQDRRWRDIVTDQIKDQNRVDFGKILAAEGKVHVQRNASYSIGVYLEDEKEKDPYAIHIGEKIEYGRPYFQKTPVDQREKIFIGRDLCKIIVQSEKNQGRGKILQLEDDVKKRLEQSLLFQYQEFPEYAVGFSEDGADGASLYLWEFNGETGTFQKQIDRIELGREILKQIE